MSKTKSKSTKVSNISKTANNVGLFSGRLNRSGFVLGSLAIVFTSVIITMVIDPLLFSVSHEASALFPFLIVLLVSIYSASLTLRRLHDLNKNGFWLLIFVPTALLELVPLVEIVSAVFVGSYSPITESLYATLESIKWVFGILGFLSFVSTFSLFYLVLVPGYKKNNKWGPPSNHWKLKEILGWK